MTATLFELEQRVEALEQSRPADLRVAVTTMLRHLEQTRDRVSKVEVRLDGISHALALLTASQAEMRGELRSEIQTMRSELRSEIQAVRSELRSEIQAVRAELKTDVAGLRRDMPGIVADALREVMRSGSKG